MEVKNKIIFNFYRILTNRMMNDINAGSGLSNNFLFVYGIYIFLFDITTLTSISFAKKVSRTTYNKCAYMCLCFCAYTCTLHTSDKPDKLYCNFVYIMKGMPRYSLQASPYYTQYDCCIVYPRTFILRHLCNFYTKTQVDDIYVCIIYNMYVYCRIFACTPREHTKCQPHFAKRDFRVQLIIKLTLLSSIFSLTQILICVLSPVLYTACRLIFISLLFIYKSNKKSLI